MVTVWSRQRILFFGVPRWLNGKDVTAQLQNNVWLQEKISFLLLHEKCFCQKLHLLTCTLLHPHFSFSTIFAVVFETRLGYRQSKAHSVPSMASGHVNNLWAHFPQRATAGDDTSAYLQFMCLTKSARLIYSSFLLLYVISTCINYEVFVEVSEWKMQLSVSQGIGKNIAQSKIHISKASVLFILKSDMFVVADFSLFFFTAPNQCSHLSMLTVFLVHLIPVDPLVDLRMDCQWSLVVDGESAVLIHQEHSETYTFMSGSSQGQTLFRWTWSTITICKFWPKFQKHHKNFKNKEMHWSS